MVVAIDLKQFPNYETCRGVKKLISMSSYFFLKKEVIGNYLFLEKATSDMDESLEMLNEASGMDFRFGRVPGKGTIKEIKEELSL